jgi:hypothetical protein
MGTCDATVWEIAGLDAGLRSTDLI